MCHLQALKQLAMRLHEGVEAGEVFFARQGWGNDAPDAGFQIFENARFGKWEFDFIPVEDLEDDAFVAMEAELFETEGDLLRRLEQIGKEENDTPPVDQPRRVLKQPRQTSAAR